MSVKDKFDLVILERTSLGIKLSLYHTFHFIFSIWSDHGCKGLDILWLLYLVSNG